MQIIPVECLLGNEGFASGRGDKCPSHDRVNCVADSLRRSRKRASRFHAEGFQFICKRGHEVYFIPKLNVKIPTGFDKETYGDWAHTEILKLVCVFAADRCCDDEQPAPAQVAFVFDAGLQGEVIVAAVDFIEEIERAQGGFRGEVFEVAVRAKRVGGLILLEAFHNEALCVSIAIDKDDGVVLFQL